MLARRARCRFQLAFFEAVDGDHFAIGGVDDGDGGVIAAAPPVDAGDVGVAGLWLVVGRRGGGLVDDCGRLARRR